MYILKIMAELIICLGNEIKDLNYLSKLIKDGKWEKIIILTAKKNINKLKPQKNSEIILINPKKTLVELSKEVKEKLKGKISGIEIAVNFVSASGKEHMALMSALLKLGLGIRLVALTPTNIQEI